MSNKPTIYIVHEPSGNLLCEDGVFRSCISHCWKKDDTVSYTRFGCAVNRVNTRKPGKAIKREMLGDILIRVIEAGYGSYGKLRHYDHNGVEVDVGHDGKRVVK